jgi:hypothetical protein
MVARIREGSKLSEFARQGNLAAGVRRASQFQHYGCDFRLHNLTNNFNPGSMLLLAISASACARRGCFA